MKELNIAKGFAMLCILYIHLAVANGANIAQIVFKYQSFSANNIGGFIVPMFFVISGFTYSKGKKSVWNEIKQKVLNLFLYFVKYFLIVGIIFSAVEVIYQKYTIIECLYALICEFLTRSTCLAISPNFYYKTDFHNVYVAVWFMWTYFFTVLIFILLERVPVKSLKEECIVIGGTGIVSMVVYILFQELPFELNIVPSMVFLMMVAQIVKKYKLYQRFTGMNQSRRAIILIIMMICGVLCLSFASVGWISHGTFSNPYGIEGMQSLAPGAVWLFAILGCLLMSYFFIYMCRLLIKLPFAGNIIAYVGVNSFDIMMLHTFFAMIICQITGLECGRNLNAGDVITMNMRIEFHFVFILTAVLCYFWPKLKMVFIKNKIKYEN